MKLLSLSVEHFRCVRKATIEFGDGLNVFYGPNDLGKSSLAHAIRAALLLQASSSEHKEFVSWSGSGDPYVELVFESEPQRIWRVRKTFGAGRSFLEESRNGVEFTSRAQGRDVDGKLSEILRWGLAPPGGKGRPKGMPMTFLSTVLLAEQERVSAIFEQALANDSDESGKLQLVAALQAMAEDPLFKAVLMRVQTQVDQAYTKTGGKRTGKNSPWVQLREEIRQKDAYDRQCKHEAQATTAIELEIQKLRSRQLESKEALERAQAAVERVEHDLQREVRRREIALRLQERKTRLSEISSELEQLAEAEERHAAAIKRVSVLVKEQEAASTARNQAQAAVEAAQQELARLQSEDLASKRLLKKSQLEGRRSELAAEGARNQSLRERIRVIDAAAAKVRSIETDIQSLAKSAAELEKKRAAAAKAVQEGEKQERELRSISHLLRWRTAQTELDQAQRNLDQLNTWLEEAVRKRSAAAALEESQPRFALPSAAQVDGLRRLEADRRVAAAKLAVGLSATVRPRRDLRVIAQLDEDDAVDHEVGGAPLELDARRQMRLEIEGVAEIAFSGGDRGARQEMERLERRWRTEAERLLQAAGVATLDGLVEILKETARRSDEIQGARRDAAQFEQRAADQPDWAGIRAEREQQLAVAEEALGDADRPALEKAARKLEIANTAETEERLAALRTKQRGLVETGNKLNGETAAANARAVEKQRSLDEARAELAQSQSTVEGDWQEAARQAADRQAEIENESKRVQAELAGLAESENQSLRAAQETLGGRKKALEAAEGTHTKAAAGLNTSKMAQATSEGELKMRREQAARLDESAAREAVRLVEAELQQAPVPAAAVSDEVLASAQEGVETARLALKQIEDEIQAKRGALQQVGGEVAKQRAEDAAEALRAAVEREHETETEYEAWELLRAKLREAEEEEGAHLGRTLADPVAKRFASLTSGRYGRLALGPGLETQGIAAAGDDRAVSLLSVGTRDQLSTLFRITLAEQLKSTILLDDQLTQTDASRMAWLRNFLRDVAGSIQVIVFTCQPDDYHYSPASDGALPAVRSIDLAQIIDRFESGRQ